MKKKSRLSSFFEGMKMINIYPSRPKNPIANKTDEELFKSDYAAVEKDFKVVFTKISQEHEHYVHCKGSTKD